ncbi:MAG: 4Fe-4S binding protein [Candidatus Polarisedimenticolia bacterium]
MHAPRRPPIPPPLRAGSTGSARGSASGAATGAIPPPLRPGPAGRVLRRLDGVVRSPRGFRTFRARLAVQGFFAFLCLLLGWRFAGFVAAARAGAAELPARPTGVDAFLPIGGLVGLFDWLRNGRLNAVHPAATILLLLFLATAFLLRKSFCSWICPIGALSDALARPGRRLFGRNVRPPMALDVPLRAVKYGLLAFFVYVVAGMPAPLLASFVQSDYNRIADVKMYLFFARAGAATFVVLGVLAAASVLVQGAWCRYLCPYGALIGIFGRFSPVKVRRDAAKCTDCGVCDRVCPARLPVSKSAAVASFECTGCLDCLASCPARGALSVGTKRRRFGAPLFAALLLALFFAGWGAARLAGAWENRVPAADYRLLVPRAEQLAHPR